MKKIIAITVLAATTLSLAACSTGYSHSNDRTAGEKVFRTSQSK